MRTYTADLPGGTATTAITIAQGGTLKSINFSILAAAAGKLEISTASVSQIGTAQPTREVLGRISLGATGGYQQGTLPVVATKLKTLDILYFHQTGAGNLGSISFYL